MKLLSFPHCPLHHEVERVVTPFSIKNTWSWRKKLEEECSFPLPLLIFCTFNSTGSNFYPTALENWSGNMCSLSLFLSGKWCKDWKIEVARSGWHLWHLFNHPNVPLDSTLPLWPFTSDVLIIILFAFGHKYLVFSFYIVWRCVCVRLSDNRLFYTVSSFSTTK